MNDEQKEKIKKCFSDKSWRLSNLYSVINKQAEKVKFKPNNVQKRILASQARRKAILKARQFGVSTYCILSLLDDTMYKRNQTNVIIAHEQDAIEKLFRIARRGYDFCKIKPVLDRGGGSKYEMYFPEINSRIYTDLCVRGDTINKLHVSEVDFIRDKQRLYASLQAVPIATGEVTLETTPNGFGSFFYDLWLDKTSIYDKLFFPWYCFEEYQIKTDALIYTLEEEELIRKAKKFYDIDITKEQIAYRRFKIKENGKMFFQEYPEDEWSCFLSSGESIFNLEIISQLIKEAPTPIESTRDTKIYEKYSDKYHYVCGADTAEGVGQDYSVAVIFNVTKRRVAAVFRDHLKPIDFAYKLNELCYQYKSNKGVYPLLAVERNNHGHAVLQELDEHILYPNLYMTKDKKVGWVTDRITRPIMINTFVNSVENRTIELNDLTILEECLTLINNDGKIEAAEGKHDDCIIASAIALQACLELVELDYNNIEEKILL